MRAASSLDNLLGIAQAEWQKVLDGRQNSAPEGPTVFLTNDNQETNDAWGDQLAEKPEGAFRVYNQNVNGISLDRRGGQFDVLCRIIREMQVDVMCGQEHKLEYQKPQVRSILYDTARQHWQRSRLCFSTSSIEFASIYKPGGTFMIANGNITGRVIKQYADPGGRWSSQTFQGGSGHRVTIASVYQVVTDVATPGSTTSAAQQACMLLQSQDPLRSPRAAFRRDLRAYLQKCQDEGEGLLVMGDFNEAIGNDPEGVVRIITDLGLVDIMSARHAKELPTTYARGRKCLDYAFASSAIADAVLSCGYEPFGHRYVSDHRGMFVDFDSQILFGTNIPKLAKYEPRMLNSVNIRQVTEYIRNLHDRLAANNVFERAERLTHAGDRHQFAERIDRDVLVASLAAEKATTRYEAPQWSQTLARARQKVQLLRKIVSCYKKKRPIDNNLTQELLQYPANDMPQSINEATKMLRAAHTEVKTIVHTSYEHREEERQRLIEELATSSAPSDHRKVKVLKTLRNSESKKRMFAKLKALRSPNERIGVTRLEIPLHLDSDPKTCTEWQTIDLPSDILFHLQERNKRHFSKAYGTPFTIPPLSVDLGFTGVGDHANAVLQGTYDLSQFEDNEALRLLLDHLKYTAEIDRMSIRPTISEEELVSKLKIWRESTSTSPSGLHLGHYKAMVARHQFSEVQDDDSDELKALAEELNTKQKQILRVHLHQLNYCLQRGYSYRRWHTIANSILFKEKGNVKIHRTRVIHIYEADYNLAMGLKWRHALYQAEELKLLNTGQFGSRPKQNATDPVLIEELQFELSRVTRKTLTQTNYDADSCYDRIVPNLAMVASQKFGVSPTVAKVNAMTLASAEYRIRTDLGLAPTGYQHSEESPVYGTGQGSGNSPALWLFLACILYDIYEKLAKLAKYCSPDRSNLIKLGMVGFVDDSNGQNNRFMETETPQTPAEVVANTQSNAQIWSDLLHSTGGALELSKCSYHLLCWKFAANGAPVLVTVKDMMPVKVLNKNTDVYQTFTLLSPYTAHKTLGCFKEPAGTQKEQFRQLQTTSDTSVAFLWKCPLTRSETWTFYFSCYLPSISYPLASSHFTKAQLDTVQRKALSIIIARCGYNRNTKREVIFGPQIYGGADFRRLYDQQGIGQVQQFLKHWRKQSIAGQLLVCLVAWCNYSVGTSRCIMEDVHTPLPHLESKWLASLRTYLATINAWIEVDRTGIAPLERCQDMFIMDAVLASKKYSNAEIQKINYCRLHLGALTIADIATTRGDYLDTDKLRGNSSYSGTCNRWMQINQERPSENEWRLWKKANSLWSFSNGKLFRPLGLWTRAHHLRRISCFAYRIEDNIAVRDGDSYLLCHNRGSSYEATDSRINYDTIPSQARPIDVHLQSDTTWTIVSESPTIAPAAVVSPHNFLAHTATLEAWEYDLLRHTELYVDANMTVHELQPWFFAGCDGSAKYGTNGAYGWAISNPAGERAAVGMGPSRGLRMDSYRAECSGLLSLLRFLIQLGEFTCAHEPWRGVIGTDSQSMLDKLAIQPRVGNELGHKFTKELDPLTPEWDLLIEIRESLRDLPGVSVVYVQGHQDNCQPYDELPLLAQLNVDADAQATKFQELHGHHHNMVLIAPNTRAQLHSLEGTITGRYDTTIRFRANSEPLREYIQSKNQWSDQTMQSINWQAHGSALKSFTKQRIHFSKLVHDCLPTHAQANRFDSGHRQCPVCDSTQEDRDHILRCPSPSRAAWRSRFWQAIEKFHQQFDTHPLLRAVFRDALGAWFQSPDSEVVSSILYPAEVRELILQQNKIGWRQIFNGRFGYEWSRLQSNHYRRRKPNSDRMTGDKWQKKFQQTIWSQWYELWVQRNEDVHGHDARTRRTAEQREVNQQLTEIYDSRAHLEPQVQQLLQNDLVTHRQQPTWVKRNWLNMTRPIIRQSFRRVQEASRKGVRAITTYFQSTSST